MEEGCQGPEERKQKTEDSGIPKKTMHLSVNPTITTIRMVEENSVVVAEGAVRVKRKEGGFLNAVFCDVFEMENAKIKRLTTYFVEVK